MSKSASVFVLSVSAAALAASAAAADPALVATGAVAAAEAAPEEEPIIIEGERSSYGASKVTSATKTSTEVKDIPQAMTIVTKAQIDDQQLRSIGDLLTFVRARRRPPAKPTATSSPCAATTPPPISSSTACATTRNISATFTISTGSRC